MDHLQEECIMRKMKFGILLVFAVLALVSVASAALPSQVTATIAKPGSATYFGVDVTNGGGEIPVAYYDGWCEDWQTYSSSYIGIPTIFDVYSSLDQPKIDQSGMPSANWNKINYVINNYDLGDANAATLQSVFWYYGFDSADGWVPPVVLGTIDPTVKATIIADADTNGGAYVPSHLGEYYAVVLWSTETAQPAFIVLPIPDIPVPEFPTLALPIAMMIGVVGAVEYVRTRKE
jgi:hypothetical protein